MRDKEQRTKRKEKYNIFVLCLYEHFMKQFFISFLCRAHACAYGTHAMMTSFFLLNAINFCLRTNLAIIVEGKKHVALLGICHSFIKKFKEGHNNFRHVPVLYPQSCST